MCKNINSEKYVLVFNTKHIYEYQKQLNNLFGEDARVVNFQLNDTDLYKLTQIYSELCEEFNIDTVCISKDAPKDIRGYFLRKRIKLAWL